MTSLERALKEITSFFESRRVPYMVIGGIATLVWGSPRSTVDVDITVQVTDAARSDFVAQIASAFALRTKDPTGFVRDTRVPPVMTTQGIPIDLMFALLPYEEQAIRRAVRRQLGEIAMQVCTAEDLIIHKIISDRLQDRADVLAVIQRQKQTLDRTYLDPIIAAMAQELEKPEIEANYRQALG